MQKPKKLDHLLSKFHTRYTAIKALVRKQSSEPSTERTGYFSLPPELRDKIMNHVLIHGNIYIQPTLDPSTPFTMAFPEEVEGPEIFRQRIRSQHATLLGFITDLAIVKAIQLFGRVDAHAPSVFHAPKPEKAKPEGQGSLPGFQLLATSRRAMIEGAPIFWSSNTFYLPPGPVCHTQSYFNNVPPHHRTLITRLGIRFSLRDLTKEVIMATEYYVRHQPDSPGRPIQSIAPGGWGKYCAQVLDKIWAEKLIWIQGIRHYHSLKAIRLDLDEEKFVEFRRDEDLRSALHAIGFDPIEGEYHYYSPGCKFRDFCLCEDMTIARFCCQQKVERVVEEIGWVGFKKWLAGKTEYPLKPWNDRDTWRY